MTTPETLNTEVVSNELRFPLVTRTVSSDARFDSYELLKSGHGAEWFWTDWTYEWISQAWGIRSVNLGESYVANLLIFSTPTHTYDFIYHSNGYNHLNTAFIRSVSGQQEI
jgi:hypothetical protein